MYYLGRDWKKGREEGLAEGRTQGFLEGQAREIIDMGLAYGLSKNDILKQLHKEIKNIRAGSKEIF